MVYNFIRHGLLALAITFLLVPMPAYAYIGPGAGLGAFAVTVAVVLGALLLLVGFVWYPLKRLIKSRKTSDNAARDQSPE